jgi:hypothetical protein
LIQRKILKERATKPLIGYILALPQGEGKMIKPTKRIDLVKWYGGTHYRKNSESLCSMNTVPPPKIIKSQKVKISIDRVEPCSMVEWEKVRGRVNYGT